MTDFIFQTDRTVVWVKFIENLPAILASCVAALVSVLTFMQSRRNSVTQKETKQAVDENSDKTTKIAERVDGMQKQLLATAEAKGQAEGKLDALAATNESIPDKLAEHKEIPPITDETNKG